MLSDLSAYHESGHALVALLTEGCDEIEKATVSTISNSSNIARFSLVALL